MRRYLSFILLVGLAYPKTDSDKLVLKSGVEYLGKFEKEENGFIYFKPKGEFGYQPVEINKVDTLLFSYESPHNLSKKHNVTFGLFSENTSLSILGYNYYFNLTEMNELFLGVGTSLLVTSISVGIKAYGKRAKISSYSTLSFDQSLFLSPFGLFTAFMPSFSVGFEYNYSDYTQIKFGGIGKLMISKSDIFILPVPFFSANFRF